MKKIVIFASGSGSNAENIITYFKDSLEISVVHVFTNNPEAGVIQRCEKHGVDYTIFSRLDFKEGKVEEQVASFNPDLIVLAGFLWLIPLSFVQRFPEKIINLHPSLLPNYGGKGMYGSNVHKAVIENKEEMTGITIHFVNEHFDKGEVLLQSSFEIEKYELAWIENKIHALEHHWLPIVIEKLLLH